MARSAALRRRSSGRFAVLACGAAFGALALLRVGGLGFAAPASSAAKGSGAPTRKQTKGNMHTRANLPPVLEVPLDEPEPEEAPKEPQPERRVPYTMHIISSFPNNKHLHEESGARKFIEKKIINSFENLEDIIKHVEVNLQVSEGFHKKFDDKKKAGQQVVVSEDEDGNLATGVKDSAKLLAPYIFKVTVSLRNQRTIVFANAEKHAQPTLTEGLDHMVDVVKKSLREEKDRMIQARKKSKAEPNEGVPSTVESMKESEQELEDLSEEIEAAKDRAAEEMYRKVEEASD